MEEIYKRRSIRKYSDRFISDNDVNKILKAGMNAPTARNLKPYEFVVIRDKNILLKLADMKKNAYFVGSCNVCIALLGHELSDYWQQDLGAVSQNMLLEATHLEIGSCWVGIAPNVEYENYVRGVLEIPENVRVFSLISLGYALENKDKNDNYDDSVVHYEKY